jgi:hypothetical protein
MKNNLRIPLSHRIFCTICLSLFLANVQAQICSDAVDTIYGLTTAGQIVGINVNNGGAVNIGTPSAGASNTNGVGYNNANKAFYYFNISGGSAGSQQFVSYDPTTSTKTVLAAPPASVLPADQIRSGCNTMAGTGYYMIDPLTSPHATLYYYNVTLNTWTTITSSMTVAGVPAGNVDSLVSGDMAFDGNGNLWIVTASKYNWALYEIAGPVPTIATASVPLISQIPTSNNPAPMFNSASFTGIAFNSAGHLYLAAGNAAGGNRLYELGGFTAAALNLVHTIPTDDGADLTSCSYPVTVLPVVWVDFAAALHNPEIDLHWTANEYGNASRYLVEYSPDAMQWQTVASVGAGAGAGTGNSGNGAGQSYSYQTSQYNPGPNYYRIVQVLSSGKENFSSIKMINTEGDRGIYIGPNPSRDVVYIYNLSNASKYLVQLFDGSGRLALTTVLNPGQQSIDISRLSKGVYLLRLVSTGNEPPVTSQLVKK